MNAKPSWNDLTESQRMALENFKQSVGASWKSKLKAHWAAGTDTNLICGHLLRQIRNQRGPKWLSKLPEAEQCR